MIKTTMSQNTCIELFCVWFFAPSLSTMCAVCCQSAFVQTVVCVVSTYHDSHNYALERELFASIESSGHGINYVVMFGASVVQW